MSLDQNFQLHRQLAADSYVLGQLSLSLVLLINDNQYPWFVLVPKRDSATEIYQLAKDDRQRLWLESENVSKVLMEIFKGDKLNVATIGNMVPQLHMHHIVRFKSDVSWPAPVWGRHPMVPYEFERVVEIQKILESNLVDFSPLELEKK